MNTVETHSRERKFKAFGIIVAFLIASEIVQVFVLSGLSIANVLAMAGALLLLVGWWQFVMTDPEDRTDLSALWRWGRFGLVLLAASFVAGIVQYLL